jgi:hypothetical protein
MAAQMMQRVTVYNGFTIFQQSPAVVELHDDNTFVLNEIDGPTGAITKTVFSVPANQLTVRGSMSMLTIAANGVKKRIDFSPGSRYALAAGGVIGLAISGSLAKKSGIQAWIDQLRAAGADVKFTGMGSMIALGVAIGVLLVIVIAGSVAAGAL